MPGGGSASGLYVLLRIDRATPWGTAHAVLRQVGGKSLYKVQFVVVGKRGWLRPLQAFLPLELAESEYVTVRVRRAADGAVVDSLDGVESPDPAALPIRNAYRSLENSGSAIAGLIGADADVPFEGIIHAIEAFANAGVQGIDLSLGSVRAVVVPRR
jgi:hypothetical protein